MILYMDFAFFIAAVYQVSIFNYLQNPDVFFLVGHCQLRIHQCLHEIRMFLLWCA